MADRKPISMSALTAGLESARGRGTASDRENLMEGRTYIPRMSKEQKALLISALQAGAKKRREKREEKRKGSVKQAAPSNSEKTDYGSVEKIDTEESTSVTEQKIKEEGFNQTEEKLPTLIEIEESSYNAKGGIIPKQKKKRTIKYRR